MRETAASRRPARECARAVVSYAEAGSETESEEEEEEEEGETEWDGK